MTPSTVADSRTASWQQVSPRLPWDDVEEGQWQRQVQDVMNSRHSDVSMDEQTPSQDELAAAGTAVGAGTDGHADAAAGAVGDDDDDDDVVYQTLG